MITGSCISDDDFKRLLHDTVTGRQRGRLLEHLKHCPICQKRWKQIRDGMESSEIFLYSEDESISLCPSEEIMLEYLDDTLDAEQRKTFEDHLKQCKNCKEHIELVRQAVQDFEQNGCEWWAQFIGEEVMFFAAQRPEIIETLRKVLEFDNNIVISQTKQPIQLHVFRPRSIITECLVAGVGEGLEQQVMYQDEPRVKFQIVQFGHQVHIFANILDEQSSYKDCLAKVEILEGDVCKLSQIILIHEGKGKCVFSPSEVRAAQSETQYAYARLKPLVTLTQLASLESNAYKPFFIAMLENKEPVIRKHAIIVLMKLFGHEILEDIRPLINDQDEEVRVTAKKVIEIFSFQ